MEKPRRGRPPLPKGQAKTIGLRVRFTPTEFARIIDLGGARWARNILLAAEGSNMTPLIVPPDPNMITVTLPPDLIKRLTDRAAKKKQPLTDYITHALAMYVK